MLLTRLTTPVPGTGADELASAAATPGANAGTFDYLLSQSPSQAPTPNRTSAVLCAAYLPQICTSC